MNILYCGDSNIQDGLMTSILSLTKNITDPLNIYVLTAQITYRKNHYRPVDDQLIALLDWLVKQKNIKSQVIKVDLTYLFNREKPLRNMATTFTPYCMLRLYADEVTQIPDRILYLDTDVMCCQDFSDYYHQNLNGTELVGTLDHYGKWWFHHQAQLFDYLNSGVLLLNLELIRKTGLFAKCRQLCRTHWMMMPDQTAINKLCHTKRIVGDQFNEQHQTTSETVFRHYSTSLHLWPVFHIQKVKPWQIERMHQKLNDHQFDDVLAEYQNLKKIKEEN